MKKYCKKARKELKKLRIWEKREKIKKPNGLYYRPKRPFTLLYGQTIPITITLYKMLNNKTEKE